MPTDPVRVAVVGSGNMGRHHVRNYAVLDGTRLAAVVDADIERARGLAARHGAEAFASVDELLAGAPGVEAVSVATPTASHRALARAAARGREARSGREADRPHRRRGGRADHAGGRARCVLAVGHVERFNPAVRELKRRVDAGAMGTLLSLMARRVGVMPPQVRDADVIVDLAVHDIDIFRYLLGPTGPRRSTRTPAARSPRTASTSPTSSCGSTGSPASCRSTG